VSIWFDMRGEGPPVVLIHAGIADSRMWEPQLESFSRSHKVVRVDLPGFGRSPIETEPISYRSAVAEAMDATGVERATLVGTSLGGRTALEFALDFPQRATALVLVGAGIDDHQWSEEVEAFGEEEEAAFVRGDFDAAVKANLDLWLAGPQRTLDEIPKPIRDLVAEMQLQAFLNTEGLTELRADRLDPPASRRLGEVSVPTLVITGDEDVRDILQIADRLAREIPGAERARIAGAAHLPSLERPEEFDGIVLGFLQEHGV
jgi:3-oxoadipate enol-lactonase